MSKSINDVSTVATAEKVSTTIKGRPGKKLTDKVKGGKKGVNLSKVAEELFQRKAEQDSKNDDDK